MKTTGYFSGFNKIKNVSIGLLYLLFLSWLMFNTIHYVPEGQTSFWITVFLSYGVLNAFILGIPNSRNQLFSVRFIDFLPRFLIFFVISGIGFYLLFNWADPSKFSLFGILSTLPLWLAFIHAFVFATTESVFWQGYLDNVLGHPWSELTAGLFHWFVWSGGALITIPSAGLLFALFSYVNYRFAKNSNDLSPAIGVHSAWNIVKIMLTPLGL